MLLKLRVTLAPAGILIVFLSKPRFRAARLIVTTCTPGVALTGGAVEGVVVEVGIGVIDMTAGVEGVGGGTGSVEMTAVGLGEDGEEAVL